MYNTVAKPTLPYGSEIWTLTSQDNFFQRKTGFTLLDYKWH